MVRRRRGRGQAVQDGKLLFLIAGIPAAMATLFGQRIQDWFSAVVWMPLPPKDRVYTGRYVALLYERFADSVRKLAKNNQSHNCMLAFVSHGSSDSVLTKRFQQEVLTFPFAERASVTFQDSPNAHVSAHVNKALRVLDQRTRLAERALQAIEKEVRSAANRTPLLLPPANFASDEIDKLLNNIRVNTMEADNPFEAVKVEVSRFCRVFPRQSFSQDQKNHFVNENGIVFRTSGHASHGAFRPDFYGDHDVWCFPRSRLRLGASFDSSFHYDCCVADSRRLPTSWRGCHQQPVSTNRSENYVNIYPNDYVR